MIIHDSFAMGIKNAAVINQVLWTREVHSLSAALARPGGGLMLVKGATKGTQSSSMTAELRR